jgi:hypothetical protein
MVNLEKHMWRRAWALPFGQWVKVIKVRKDSLGVDIYDCDLSEVPSGHSTGMHLFRRQELRDIQWVPYGSKR